MKIVSERNLADGRTLALVQFCTHNRYKVGLRLVWLRPGLNSVDFKRIDQRGGGVKLLQEWTASWNKNPGPRSSWTKILSEGNDKLNDSSKSKLISKSDLLFKPVKARIALAF
jgi:hypothetical protein